MSDIIKDLQSAGFQPELIEDKGGFNPFTGRYICRIDDAGHRQGTSQKTGEAYDFRAISMQVVEIVEGDKAINRYLSRNYNIDADGTKKLLNDLFTAGIQFTGKSDEELDAYLGTLKDKTVFASAWISKEFIAKDGRKIPAGKQAVRIVKEFTKRKDKPAESKSDIPF